MIRVWHIPGYLRNASLADLLLSSMPTIAVIAASLLGLALAGISLMLQRVEGPASFRKSLADLLLRLSVAMLAITAGFFVFFGQRWLEDVNSQIDQANETLANMDIIQSEYMSEVENAYYLNDAGFLDVQKTCKSILKKYDEIDGGYCYADIADGFDFKGSEILDALDYFDFQIPDTFAADFKTNFDEQSFLKRAVKDEDLLENIFKVHENLAFVYSVMRDELTKLHALVEKDISRKLLTKLNPETKIGSSKNDGIAVIAHRVCCVVGIWGEQFTSISKYASQQAANFCAIRDAIGKAVKDATSSMVFVLANSRVQEVEARINEAKAATQCTYIPLPMDGDD